MYINDFNFTSKDKRNNKHSPIKAKLINHIAKYFLSLTTTLLFKEKKGWKRVVAINMSMKLKLRSNKYEAVLSTSIKLNSPLWKINFIISKLKKYKNTINNTPNTIDITKENSIAFWLFLMEILLNNKVLKLPMIAVKIVFRIKIEYV